MNVGFTRGSLGSSPPSAGSSEGTPEVAALLHAASVLAEAVDRLRAACDGEVEAATAAAQRTAQLIAERTAQLMEVQRAVEAVVTEAGPPRALLSLDALGDPIKRRVELLRMLRAAVEVKDADTPFLEPRFAAAAAGRGGETAALGGGGLMALGRTASTGIEVDQESPGSGSGAYILAATVAVQNALTAAQEAHVAAARRHRDETAARGAMLASMLCSNLAAVAVARVSQALAIVASTPGAGSASDASVVSGVADLVRHALPAAEMTLAVCHDGDTLREDLARAAADVREAPDRILRSYELHVQRSSAAAAAAAVRGSVDGRPATGGGPSPPPRPSFFHQLQQSQQGGSTNASARPSGVATTNGLSPTNAPRLASSFGNPPQQQSPTAAGAAALARPAAPRHEPTRRPRSPGTEELPADESTRHAPAAARAPPQPRPEAARPAPRQPPPTGPVSSAAAAGSSSSALPAMRPMEAPRDPTTYGRKTPLGMPQQPAAQRPAAAAAPPPGDDESPDRGDAPRRHNIFNLFGLL